MPSPKFMPNVPPHSHGTWEAKNGAFLLPIPIYLPIPSFRSVSHFCPTSARHQHTFNTASPYTWEISASAPSTKWAVRPGTLGSWWVSLAVHGLLVILGPLEFLSSHPPSVPRFACFACFACSPPPLLTSSSFPSLLRKIGDKSKINQRKQKNPRKLRVIS